MRDVDVIVIGGGPAGSAAATRLSAAGADVLVIDKQSFPRHKLCAGWVTPQVLKDVEFDSTRYPHGFLNFRRLHWHLKGLHLPVPCVQHSIRRFEFDHWLLERSGAKFVRHSVKQIASDDGGRYLIDGEFRCRYLIGAGGTSCPAYRLLFAERGPRSRALQVATLELEFPHHWRDPDCHLWFFEHQLPGYSWYVPKANGFLNVGVGALAARLKRQGASIRDHWRHLTSSLECRLKVRVGSEPQGYSYYVRGPHEAIRIDNAFLTGDAAGLATRDLCEGIGPAIQSGQRAADSILSGAPYSLEGISQSSLGGGWLGRCMDFAMIRGAA